MLIGAEEGTAVALDKRAPGGVRLLWRVEAAEVSFYAVHCGARYKPSAARRVPYTARQIARPQAAVPKVLLLGSLTQIVEAIVESVSVVVIKARGPFAGYHCPDDAVQQNMASANADKEVVSTSTTGGLSRVFVVPSGLVMLALEVMQRACLPRQNARFGIAGKTLMQISG